MELVLANLLILDFVATIFDDISWYKLGSVFTSAQEKLIALQEMAVTERKLKYYQ